jgi:uncharacterized YigZ family protein
MFSDTYLTLKSESEILLKEKGSRFMAFAYPVTSESDIKHKLQTLREIYPDATHHCYAWFLGPNRDASRANDDGEPAGSAGKPIQRALQSAGVTHSLVVVVRYFGGTLLGVPGLIQSYGEAARQAIAQAGITEQLIREYYQIDTDYIYENEVFRLIKQHKAEMIQIYKSERVRMEIAIRKKDADAFIQKISALRDTQIQWLRQG